MKFCRRRRRRLNERQPSRSAKVVCFKSESWSSPNCGMQARCPVLKRFPSIFASSRRVFFAFALASERNGWRRNGFPRRGTFRLSCGNGIFFRRFFQERFLPFQAGVFDAAVRRNRRRRGGLSRFETEKREKKPKKFFQENVFETRFERF